MKKLEIQMSIYLIMLTHFSERIFDPNHYNAIIDMKLHEKPEVDDKINTIHFILHEIFTPKRCVNCSYIIIHTE